MKKRVIILTVCISVMLSVFPLQIATVETENSDVEMTSAYETLDVPEVIESEIVKEKGHIKRIREGEEDLRTAKFLNQDGTVSVYKFGENIKYIDKDGNIKDKANILTHKGKYYTNENNDINSYFPEDIHNGVEIRYDNVVIKTTPIISKDTDAKINVSDENIVFAGVFGENTSVVYTPTYSGYKEDIILDAYTGINQFTFLCETGSCELVNCSDIIKIYYEDEEVGTLGNIFVVDQKGLFSDGYYELEEIKNSDATHAYKVTVCVDPDFLLSNDVEYPIIVDPSVTINYNNTSETTKYILDATIYSGTSASYPGLLTFNDVGYRDATYGYGRTVTRFPGLMEDPTFLMVPTDRITSVKYYTYCIGYTKSITVYAYQYNGTSGWTEMTTSFANVYTNDSTKNTWKTISAVNTTFAFDITNLVKAWKTNTSLSDLGIMFKNVNESSADYKVRFSSTETSTAANKPYLVYEYSQTSTYNIKSYYSNRYISNVSNAATVISNANQFTKKVFNQFGVTLNYSTSNISNRKSKIDDCQNGLRVACNSTCGSDCSDSHHRNYKTYCLDLYNISRSANDIVVGWDFVHSSSVCYESTSGSHTLFKAMGLVPGMDEMHTLNPSVPTSASRGILRNYSSDMKAYYWDGAPIIAIFESCVNMDTGKAQDTAKLVLAHEMAHVMGIYDVYGYSSYTDHIYNSGTWPCIMKAFGDSDLCDEFVEIVEADINNAFCSDCCERISDVISTRYFLGN